VLGVYNATKYAVEAFSESLRQRVTGRHVRVSVVAPDAVATALSRHNPEILEDIKEWFRHRAARSPTFAGSSPGVSMGADRWPP
jgi:NADP-dependent 3-hydroxy acid dehydrogenase YdfG